MGRAKQSLSAVQEQRNEALSLSESPSSEFVEDCKEVVHKRRDFFATDKKQPDLFECSLEQHDQERTDD